MSTILLQGSQSTKHYLPSGLLFNALFIPAIVSAMSTCCDAMILRASRRLQFTGALAMSWSM